MGRTRHDAGEWNWEYVPKLLGESLLYPIRASSTLNLLKSVVVGGLLISPFVFLLSTVGREGLRVAWQETTNQTAFILIVAIAVLLATVPFGYLLRVIQNASADEELPTFRNWKRLALLGTQVAAIYFFYLSFPLEILLPMLADIGSILGGLLTTIPEIYLIVFLYLYPAAVARFAEEERLLSALPQRLKSTIWSWTYTVGAVTSGLIGGVIYVISRQPLEQTSPHLIILMGLVVFYLFIAQHYVIGRTWRAVEAERSASESLETSPGTVIPTDRIDTGELRETGVLSTEDVAMIRGRFETAMREPDPSKEQLLKALRTLYERGVLTREEYEENHRVIAQAAESADREPGPTSRDREAPGPTLEGGDQRPPLWTKPRTSAPSVRSIGEKR